MLDNCKVYFTDTFIDTVFLFTRMYLIKFHVYMEGKYIFEIIHVYFKKYIFFLNDLNKFLSESGPVENTVNALKLSLS